MSMLVFFSHGIINNYDLEGENYTIELALIVRNGGIEVIAFPSVLAPDTVDTARLTNRNNLKINPQHDAHKLQAHDEHVIKKATTRVEWKM